MQDHAAGKRVTLQDIARQTGYTINTVSRALRNKEDISLQTRTHIQETAQAMGYIPNMMASSLRSGRTRILGVVLGFLENPYYAILANKLVTAAEKKGYTLVMLCSQDEPERELKLVNNAIAHHVDGILLFPSKNPQPAIDRITEAGLPFVILARDLPQVQTGEVIGDDAQGMYLAAMHLIEHGRRRLGYFSREKVTYSTEARQKGFLRACEEAGIPEADIRISIDEKQSLESILTAWVQEGVNGLCAFCDSEAWQALHVLSRHGIRVPEDVSVIGYDNLQESLGFPSLICSVGFDAASFAESAIRLIRQQIHDPAAPPQRIVCPYTLTCRGSCG